MRWWKASAILTLAAALGTLGCGSSSSNTIAVTISPTSASVITNRTQLFTTLVTGTSNTAINWSLTCATNVASNACGSIDGTGLYTAPATIPTVTSSGTTTIAPTVTIKATSQADTSKTATATLTIVTGISITITPTTATVGTGEHFLFAATVNNPGCNLTSNPTCQNVTWSLSTTLTGIGTIGSTSGVYTAPTSVPSPSTVIITATSVADTSVTATATVTVVTAANPTVTSVSPQTTGLGGLFQDIYITGTNFISTENVFVNGAQLASSLLTNVSTSVIRARIPDYILAVPPPSNQLVISVAEQSGMPQTCTASADCAVTVVSARPGLVGPNPASIPQGNAGVLSFGVDGGYFGTGSNPASPAVTATYNGLLRGIQLPASQTIGSTRQLSVTIGGGSNSSDFTVPGLYPVTLKSSTDPTKSATANLAVQPNYSNGSSITPLGSVLPVGTTPSDVAINTATGVAVVANQASGDVTLIDINPSDPGTPKVINPSICTGATGTAASPCAVASGPTSVSVDYVRNIALVVNSTTKTIALVDLAQQSVRSVSVALQDTPGAIAINPLTGRALVAMQQKNYGVLVDVTQGAPAFAGIVSISTGPNTRVAVEPNLNWALASPGGVGSLGVVDLGQQSSNPIIAASRTSNVVTITVQVSSTSAPLSIQVGDAVQIQSDFSFPGASTAIAGLAPSFVGFYTVNSVGPASNQFSFTQTGASQTDVATQSSPQAATGTVAYSQPVATVGLPLTAQGIAINPETQQAVLVDPTTGGVVTFFSLLDQSVSSLNLTSSTPPDLGTISAAYNPLTNSIVAVNLFSGTLSVIDPTVPRRLTDYSGGGLICPAAVAIDPSTNIAVVVNQATNPPVCNTGGGTASILSLGPIQPFSITSSYIQPLSGETPTAGAYISTSALKTAPTPQAHTLVVYGKGLTCVSGSTSLVVRLDGTPLATSCSVTGDRQLSALVPASMLTFAHRYALDVAQGSTVTNVEDFAVEQSIDLNVSSCTAAPQPSGVAIDPEQNIAAVTLFGCNAVALIDMTKGSGTTVAVGSNPIGVASLPRLHLAVVANNGGAGTASIVDEVNQRVSQTVSTGSGPTGVSSDDATGEVAIANSVANTVTVINAVTGGTSSISTGQRPIATAFNYTNHQVAVAASSGNSIGVSDGGAGSQSESFNVSEPTSVVYDPVPTDCGSNNNGTTTNTTGCFIAASSTGNQVEVIDPLNSVVIPFRVGINPTAIAYNYQTSTLVSTNTGSHTVTVADFLGQKIRAVLSLPPAASANTALALSLAFAGSPQYALDIHPLTNVAVIADTVNGRVLFVPLPH